MRLVEGVGGALVVGMGLVDLFLTVFNYDGFTFLAGRWQRGLWRVARGAGTLLPRRARHGWLSLASAGMLPATVAQWLGLEVAGFGLVYHAGLTGHGLAVSHGLGEGFGSAMYFSAGDITTLTFGDVVAARAVYRAAVDLEAMVGLATFTLALGYLVTTFRVLGDLDALHNTVRRHAEDPGRPSSVLVRHYRGGQPAELPDLLQVLSDRLESYDEGLRRYPVVYFFHTRRVERSVPRVFWTLGELAALLRWGLPPDEPMTADPWLAALIEQYGTTIRRLQRSFVGPHPLPPATPVPRESFAAAYPSPGGADPSVGAFLSVQTRARAAAGLDPPPDADTDAAYGRYREWCEFVHTRDVVLERITKRLGYDLGAAVTDPATAGSVTR